jgi:hypothetical protein
MRSIAGYLEICVMGLDGWAFWISVDWIKTVLGLMESLDSVFGFFSSNMTIYFLS